MIAYVYVYEILSDEFTYQVSEWIYGDVPGKRGRFAFLSLTVQSAEYKRFTHGRSVIVFGVT